MTDLPLLLPHAAAPPPAPLGRLADEVYSLIQQDIAYFRRVPGDRFTEGDIATQLGISRTPVRQALFRLRDEGLVELLFRSGWRVRPFNFARFEQLYELRRVLEITSVHRLCEGGRTPGHALLDALAHRWLAPPQERSTDANEVALWDEDFHCDIVEAAGNEEIARVHREVTERIRIIRRLDFTRLPRIDAAYQEHAQILSAILTKRGNQAAMLLRAHIESSQAEVHKITLHQVHMAQRAGRGGGA
ncbi:FCD domain-containing protein [Xylophilus rhododendri]|uniref:FCD domain-containing protein n=1 Tax=Xylophilus rhododendri TaxID=2697032 RepID=A0A857J7R2_9BURK|nr:GntR family transcriptional regulator [Xylophilus rhododendri]QHI99042.1 FCD domain-containing protein [Xylophilus rhododendri]